MLDVLEQFFAYKLEKLPNRYGYELIVWDEYGLSIKVKGGTQKETIKNLQKEVRAESWS